MDIYVLLIIGHLAGTALAIGGATLIEFHLTKALKDGQVTPEEGAMLGVDYNVVRVGFIISVLTGFGFLLYYKFVGQHFRLYDPVLWAKFILVIIVGVNALLLQAHKINLYWGAAFSFVSWWGIGLLGVFLTNGVKFDIFDKNTFASIFTSVIITYAICVVAGAYVLHKVRSLFKPHSCFLPITEL